MAVLKTCLRYPEAPGDAIEMGLRAEHFSDQNALIFDAILSVARTDTPVSQQTVARALMTAGQLERAGGQTTLQDIWRNGDVGLAHYGQIVRERAAVRREHERVARYLDRLGDPAADFSREAARFRNELLREDEAEIRQDGPRSIAEILESGGYAAIDQWAHNPRAIRGIPTGHPVLDRLMGGLAPRRMSVIGASTSAGKTQWMQYMARLAAIGGSPTLLLSTEMSTLDNSFRWAFMEAGFDKLYAEEHGLTDPERQKLMESVARLAERPMYAWEMGGFDTARIRVAVRRMKARYGIRLVLLDMMNGVQIPVDKGKNLAQALTDVMRDLHTLAVAEDVHLMATAHVSKEAMRRGDMLGLNDFRDTAAVEQWADQAMMLMPIDQQGNVITREQANRDAHELGYVTVLANLCKNRFGSLGTVRMRLDWDAGGRFEVA